MKKNTLHLSAAAVVFFFIVTLFIKAPVRAEDGKDYDKYIKENRGFYAMVINFLRAEQKEKKTIAPAFNDYALLFGVDLVFSLFCLFLALFMLIGKKVTTIKNFCWFIFIINVLWFVFLVLYQIAWNLMDYLVIKLRSDLGAPFADSFSFIAIVIGILLYIWVLARTFHLSFYGSLGAFLFSHLCYLVIIFVVFSFVTPGQDRTLTLLKENLGASSIIDNYLSDVKKITSNQPMSSLLRVRPYHL